MIRRITPRTSAPGSRRSRKTKTKSSGAAHDASAATDYVLSLERVVSRAGDSGGRQLLHDRHRADPGHSGRNQNSLKTTVNLIGSADRESSAGGELQSGSGERENAGFVARIEPGSGVVYRTRQRNWEWTSTHLSTMPPS